jgi:hypothetical protein
VAPSLLTQAGHSLRPRHARPRDEGAVALEAGDREAGGAANIIREGLQGEVLFQAPVGAGVGKSLSAVVRGVDDSFTLPLPAGQVVSVPGASYVLVSIPRNRLEEAKIFPRLRTRGRLPGHPRPSLIRSVWSGRIGSLDPLRDSSKALTAGWP